MHYPAATLCSAVLSAAVSPAETPRIPHIAFEKYTLPNGLDVILHEDHSTPIVDVNLWYHVGSKNERPGRTGFAHLFEHMMFQGSQHYDRDFFGPLQKAGGRLNGSTNTDYTNYWETVPANYLELALWLESDRMGFLLPAMDRPKLDNQRDVVKNERRQGYENRPYGLVHETILAAMYPPDHPYSWPVIGAMADLDAASRDDVADFFRRYYHPSNASLCIAGDFQPAEAKRWVAKYFGSLPPGPKAQRLKPWVPELKEEQRIRMTDRVGLPRLYLTWHTVPRYAADDAELEVLAHVLAGTKAARLYQSLVREKQIAQDVQAAQDSAEVAGHFSVVITARPGHTLAELEAAAADQLRRIRSEPPSAEELARAVNQFEARFVQSLESVGGFGGRADRLNRYNVLAGDPGFLVKDFERFLRVDGPSVTRVAQKYLGDNRVVVEVTPGSEVSIVPDPREAAGKARQEMVKRRVAGAERSEAPESSEPGARSALPQPPVTDSVDRGRMPPSAAEPKFQLPPIHRSRLSNGMEVLVVENHEFPVVNLNVVFPVGRCQDPAAKPGLAAMLAALWDGGTRRRSAEEIAAQLAGMGASLSVAANWDTSSVRLFTLKRQLAPALDVYADVLRNPEFPQAELDRQRTMALGRLAQVRNEPRMLAGIAVDEIIYGPDHPYGRPQSGTPAALKGMTREDVAGFYQAQVRPDQAGLIAVGDVAPAELIGELEKMLGDWKAGGGEHAVLELPPVPEPRPASVVLVERPGAAQSVISVALVGAPRKSPDYFSLLVMNTVLGGQFSSRLNMNLREDKGFTYGARSAFEWRVHQPGPLVAVASVQTAVTAAAVTEFLKEYAGMVGGRPVGGEELDFCRKYVTRGFPAGFETPHQVAGQLETLWVYGLPDDYFNTVVPGVGAVTGDDVLRVAKQYIRPQQVAVIVVGDREKVEGDLRKLPVGKNLAVFQFDDDFRLVPAK